LSPYGSYIGEKKHRLLVNHQKGFLHKKLASLHYLFGDNTNKGKKWLNYEQVHLCRLGPLGRLKDRKDRKDRKKKS
jgi:hypothetical protein